MQSRKFRQGGPQLYNLGWCTGLKMTSSLSRQLASLKSDSGIGAVADLSQGVTTRQSLLTGESGSSLALSAAQVQLLARQGLTNLSKNVRILKAFEDVVFPPSDQHGDQGTSMQIDVEEDDTIVDAVDKSHLTLENLLVILSPHLLGKDAQFILQFLMNQHQVRYAKEYALFVFSIDGPKQNATSLLTPVSNLVFHALSSGTPSHALHGSFNNHVHERI